MAAIQEISARIGRVRQPAAPGSSMRPSAGQKAGWRPADLLFEKKLSGLQVILHLLEARGSQVRA
jgi:hypothetical protein